MTTRPHDRDTRTKTNIDDIRDHIVATEKVAHVTFYLVKDRDPFGSDLPEGYFVYTESRDRGLEPLNEDGGNILFCTPMPYEEALGVLRSAIQKLENILAKKRKGMPTSKQVYFLFVHKIPIPADLTWGQASDLIDEKLNQLEYEKQVYLQKKAEKYNGFAVGQRITFQFFHPERLAPATITKLTDNGHGAKYMYVEYDNNTPGRWPLSGLPKIVKEES